MIGRVLRFRVYLLLAAATVNAAFLLEVDTDGLDDGVLTYNAGFSFGGDTTLASSSVAGTAYGLTGGDSIFGGDGVAQLDTYIYTYNPSLQADNLVVAALQDLGNGNFASGSVGGGVGFYNIYATWPLTANVSGGDTRYSTVTAGDSSTADVDPQVAECGDYAAHHCRTWPGGQWGRRGAALARLC